VGHLDDATELDLQKLCVATDPGHGRRRTFDPCSGPARGSLSPRHNSVIASRLDQPGPSEVETMSRPRPLGAVPRRYGGVGGRARLSPEGLSGP